MPFLASLPASYPSTGERCWSESDLHRDQDEPGPEAAEPVEKRTAGRREARAVRRVVGERGGGGSNSERDVSAVPPVA